MHKPSSIRAGFSMVEVLVVLALLGLSSAMVLFVARTPERQIYQTTERLQAKLNKAAELALTSGDMTAMGFTADSWTLYRFTGDNWMKMEQETLSGRIRLSLELESSIVVLGKAPEPVIWFEPVGVSSWFRLKISDTKSSRFLFNPGTGQTRLESKS